MTESDSVPEAPPPEVRPRPRGLLPAAVVAAYSATMSGWLMGLTTLKEGTLLDRYPQDLFDFIIHWYFFLLGIGIYPGIAVSLYFLFLGWKRSIPASVALGVPLFLGLLWGWVGWLLIGDNLGNVFLRGEPFHWPH